MPREENTTAQAPEPQPEPLEPDLRKWPRLLVAGDPVTREQASEILLRTNARYLCVNDRVWEARACEILGIPPERHSGGAGGIEWFKQSEQAWEALGSLSLHYLHNARIASSWIGGPHGWCDWNGLIGCSDFNIGKWPSHGEVTEDWTRIAQAFPYLRLRTQLIIDEGAGGLGGTWDIEDGQVTYQPDVTALVTPPHEVSETRMLATVLLGMEQGVSAERLTEAVAQVRASVAESRQTASKTPDIG